EDNARFCGGLGVRVPSPLLSGIFGSDSERVAAFLDLSVSSINRDIASPDNSGTLLFVSLGLDAAFYRDENWDARVQLGGQYGYFGGVDGLDNGFALLVGLRGALRLGEQVWLVLNPQVTFAKSSNHIFFLNLGV